MKRIMSRINHRRLPARSLALAILVAAASGLPAEQSAQGTPAAELVAGMVAFDRAYIPVLALSNQNKPEASRKAMTILKEQWSFFAKEFGGRYPEADWRQGFARTDAILARSEELLKNNDLAGAHGALEGVRDIFTGLRERRSIPYYVDYLNRYHESMEAVSGITAGRTAATLEDDQVGQVSALLPEARSRWAATLDAPFDATVYGFPAAKAEQLRTAEQAVMQGIRQVEQALLNGDGEALIKAVEGLKPAFTRTFLMFGDFDRVNR